MDARARHAPDLSPQVPTELAGAFESLATRIISLRATIEHLQTPRHRAHNTSTNTRRQRRRLTVLPHKYVLWAERTLSRPHHLTHHSTTFYATTDDRSGPIIDALDHP